MTPPTNANKPQSIAQQIAWLVFFYGFGLFNWTVYIFRFMWTGLFFQKPSEQDQLRFAISRDQFWNLSKQPFPGFEHAFFKTRAGKKLHYVTNRSRSAQGGQTQSGNGNLFVLLHGFPDTYAMWRYMLKDPAIPHSTARIVCLDLPNFGGSDTFDPPDTTVLEAIAEFVLAIREEHENDAGVGEKDFSTVLVADDWGCAIGFRLAAEAPQLADRFVLMNGPHVALSLANKDRIVAAASKIFQQFRESPRQHFSCLQKSFNVAKPLLFQILLFGYMFAFHLPKLMVQYLATGGNMSFLRAIAKAEHGRHQDECDVQAYLAGTLGPGVVEVESQTKKGETYGRSVYARAASPGETFWHQTAYYRNGLGTKKWEKSLEIIAGLYEIESESASLVSPTRRRSSSSASSALFMDRYDGALKAPVTILWGEKDLAVSKAVCLDGISDYLAAGSEVILLPRSGHWVGVEKESRAALAKIIALLAATPAGQALPTYMVNDVEHVYTGAVSMGKR